MRAHAFRPSITQPPLLWLLLPLLLSSSLGFSAPAIQATGCGGEAPGSVTLPGTLLQRPWGAVPCCSTAQGTITTLQASYINQVVGCFHCKVTGVPAGTAAKPTFIGPTLCAAPALRPNIVVCRILRETGIAPAAAIRGAVDDGNMPAVSGAEGGGVKLGGSEKHGAQGAAHPAWRRGPP